MFGMKPCDEALSSPKPIMTAHDSFADKIQPQHVENGAAVDRRPSSIRNLLQKKYPAAGFFTSIPE